MRNRSKAKKVGYEYCGNEERDRPTFREYETYRKNGLKAKKLNENELRRRIGLNINTNFQHLHVDGVYGLWCLDVLPYAKFIHWTVDFMHSASNVCGDIIDSIRPTHSAVTGLFYKHENRTYNEDVVKACNEHKIFNFLNDINKPNWVLEVSECLDVDRGMKNVLGYMTNEDIFKNTMRAGHAEKSHDTIYWCIVFLRSAIIFIIFELILTSFNIILT